MNSAISRAQLADQRELIQRQLQLNRLYIAQRICCQEDVFPRSIAMQLITQQKLSDILRFLHILKPKHK